MYNRNDYIPYKLRFAPILRCHAYGARRPLRERITNGGSLSVLTHFCLRSICVEKLTLYGRQTTRRAFDDNEISVFVSHPFTICGRKDLLAKEVFPQAVYGMQAAGGLMTIVDLRWGITQAKAQNMMLFRSLAEIDR
jgi:hypothetical protein